MILLPVVSNSLSSCDHECSKVIMYLILMCIYRKNLRKLKSLFYKGLFSSPLLVSNKTKDMALHIGNGTTTVPLRLCLDSVRATTRRTFSNI